MEKIVIVDLSKETVRCIPYDGEWKEHYGRGLAFELLTHFVPEGAGRFDEENAVVLVPGLLSGCPVPSACRLLVVTKEDKNRGMQVCNTTGNLPQKLGSLNVAAVVLLGKSKVGNAVVHISKEAINILHKPELENQSVPHMVRSLKDEYGDDTALLGVGGTGDKRLSLSTFYCTYPDGVPEFHCPRSGFGDVFGSKGFRALAVNAHSYFERECHNRDGVRDTGKELAARIINNEICGGALPAYGSSVILDILKRGKELNFPGKEKKKSGDGARKERMNYCCAPMCVVGCLNRHTASDGEQYASPDQSEVLAALEKCFGSKDMKLVRAIQQRAGELCVVGTEFVTAAKVYFEAVGEEPNPEKLTGLLEEIGKGSLIGRVVASRTTGIAALFCDKEELRPWLDRTAIMDEKDFEVSMKNPYKRLSGLTDLELLYAQIFVLENMGICIFTSFALLNEKDTFEKMARLYTQKTGRETTAEELLSYALACIRKEETYHKAQAADGIRTGVPPFTKVLYRYFSK